MKLKFLLPLGVIISLFVLAGLFFIWAEYQIKVPLSKTYQEKKIIIERGEGLKDIAIKLKNSEVTRSKFWFEFYAFYKGWANSLQAGEYTLSSSMSISEIAPMIASGEAESQEKKVTIPEGFTLKQIDQRLRLIRKHPVEALGLPLEPLQKFMTTLGCFLPKLGMYTVTTVENL